MMKNKRFARYAVAFCVLGIVFMFMYSGLQNDLINIIQSFSAWSKTSTQQPLAVGNLVCISVLVNSVGKFHVSVIKHGKYCRGSISHFSRHS